MVRFHPDVEAHIRELVDSAPEFTDDQINRIRLILHAGINTEDAQKE